MKYRALTLAFAVCFVSSLVLADNPTDAQLMPNGENTLAVQHENCPGHNRRQLNKKDKSLSPKVYSQTRAKRYQESQQSAPANTIATER